MILAIETASLVNRRGRDRQLRKSLTADAEGATAPETLRQKDRDAMGLWKAGVPT